MAHEKEDAALQDTSIAKKEKLIKSVNCSRIKFKECTNSKMYQIKTVFNCRNMALVLYRCLISEHFAILNLPLFSLVWTITCA